MSLPSSSRSGIGPSSPLVEPSLDSELGYGFGSGFGSGPGFGPGSGLSSLLEEELYPSGPHSGHLRAPTQAYAEVCA